MTRAEFVGFVRAARMGVVATVDAEGNPEAALVDLAVTDDAELVFDTKATARKVANLGTNPRVALVVGWNEGVSVQVEGVAEIVTGAERDTYVQIHQAQLQKSSALRDDFDVVRVVPTWLRHYDARPGSFSVVQGFWE